jgi:5-methylcytosine-specific restriction endonuclease McrA
MVKRVKAIKTHNNNTLTESEYFSKIRSSLRKSFQYWKPMSVALELSSRKYTGENKRIKKEYQCACCGEWFIRKDVQIDHIIPCGSLRTFDDIVPFIKNLTQEDPSAYQILCHIHHLNKTNIERKLRTTTK